MGLHTKVISLALKLVKFQKARKKSNNSKELMRAGNNFLRCTAAEGGQERPCKAQLGTGRPRTGGVHKCGTPWEQVQGA